MNLPETNSNIVTLSKGAKAARDAVRPMATALNALSASLPRSTTLPMLAALTLTGKHVYAGTADPRTVARNRAANKRARAQRRVNAQRNFRKGVR